MGAVRGEFRAELYLPDPADPVLGLRPCLVGGCDRSTYASKSEHGMCSRHAERWRQAGRPDLSVFAADPGPRMNGRSEPGRCTAAGCRFGVNALGLCMRHYGQWKRAGRPDRGSWAPSEPPPVRAQCTLPFCSLWVENIQGRYCRTHTTRWRQLRRPDHDQYVEWCLLRGRARVDFRGLAPQLRLEFQYAMQCRHDQQTISTPPYVVRWAIRQAQAAAVASLLDLSADRWREFTVHAQWQSARAFLLYAYEVVETLRDGTGWEVEYPREVWRLHTLPGLKTPPGKPRPRNHLRFDRVGQPWLRALAKRFIRLRLSCGLSVSTAVADLAALTRFSAFLAQASAAGDALADLDRAVLERYLAWLATQPGGHSVKEDCVTVVGTFFTAIRQHGWDDTLPTTAVFFPGDLPKRPPRVTRHLAEYVMAQVENPANLDRWPTPAGRLVTVILIRCGLRASDACTLPFDCLLHDGQGAPYLRYYNNKMAREAAVPIDEELQADIRAQQQRVAARWPDTTHQYLFPHEKGNASGQQPLTYHSYRGSLIRWLADCDIRNEHGQPAKLTPHQWRHTFACRLINRDVPQEVIRVLLDHQSTEMTAHYARITDQTVRRRWEQAVKVNVNGEPVAIEPDGPLAQAQWAKTRYGLATQTLPHGYCGLPVQKSCPHANACLTCPVFLTGPEFLPELREHRHRTLTLIDTAHTAGQTRVAQMNTEVLTNLDRMINGIEQKPGDAAHAS